MNRSVIGSYVVKAQLFSCNILLYDKKCGSRARKRSFLKIFGHLNLKKILVVMIQTIISGEQLQCGDIETNLGPAYKEIRISETSLYNLTCKQL